MNNIHIKKTENIFLWATIILIIIVSIVFYYRENEYIKDNVGSRRALYLVDKNIQIQNLKRRKGIVEISTVDMKSELDMLRKQVSNINQQIISIKAFQNQLLWQTGKSTEENGESAISDEEKEEQVESNIQTQIQDIEHILASEKIDTVWSDSLDSILDEALNFPQMQGMTLINKNCRSTLCKLEFTFDKYSIDMEDIDEMVSLVGQSNSFIRVDEEASSVLLFFSREGYTLPEPELIDG